MGAEREPASGTAESGAPAAQRSLGGSELFTFAFGAIIGVSWIVLVGEWLQLAGPLGASLAFAIGGLIALVAGYSYAELGSLYPRIGGELVFANRIFGPNAAHAVGWVLLLLYLSLVAFESVSVSWIIATMFPAVLGPALYAIGPSTIHAGGAAVGIGASLGIAAINYRGAKSAGRLQDVLTITKIAVALLFVGFGLRGAEMTNYTPLFGSRSGPEALRGFLTLVATTPLFFAGFGVVTQAMGAAKPSEFGRLGRILIAVIGASIAFYALVILVVGGLLPPDKVSTYEMPAAKAFELAFQSRLMTSVVLMVGLLGLMTVWNAVFFAAVRVIEGMGEQGLVGGRWLRRPDEQHSAGGAVLLVLAVSIAGTLLGRGILLPIVSVGGLAVTLLFLFVSTACLVRRRRMPGAVAPYVVPGGMPMIWAGILLSLALVLASLFGLVTGTGHGVSPELIVVVAWSIAGYAVWRLRPQPVRVSPANADVGSGSGGRGRP